MMKAARTSETSVNVYQTTWYNNPEDSHLHTRRQGNLKSSNFETDAREILSIDRRWMEVTEDCVDWQALVLSMLNLRVLLL
jgi:hypothetical protein